MYPKWNMCLLDLSVCISKGRYSVPVHMRRARKLYDNSRVYQPETYSGPVYTPLSLPTI